MKIASHPRNPSTQQQFGIGRRSRQERDFLPWRPAPQNGLMRRQEQRDSKLRAKKPATSGPRSQVSTTLRMARLGGGRSRSRTGLSIQIPANREINSEFCKIWRSATNLRGWTRANPMACGEIPYSAEQGIFLQEQGICAQ